jgi:hypothetical protein
MSKQKTVSVIKNTINLKAKLLGIPVVVRKVDTTERFVSMQVVPTEGLQHLTNLTNAVKLAENIEEQFGWDVFVTEHNSAL